LISSSVSSAASTATILLIDDQAEVVQRLTAMLASAGYRWDVAADDRSATDLALKLCDINLHGVNGIELCQQLKQLDGMAEVPTLFLSSAQSPDIIRRAHAWYVRKLLDPQVILKLIEQELAEVAGRQLAHA